MTKLVVSGGGDHTDTKKIDALYKGLLVNKKILYIPRAMRPEEYPSCLEWIQNIFPISEGYSVDVLSEKEFTENNKNHLDDYDGMYIGGGNTYRLLKLIRDTGFSDIIQRFIDNNKPIYGGSAGAIIMGKEIHTAADMNAVKLSFEETLGYNVCKDYSIVCHYNEESENEIKDYAKYYQIPVICLPEGTGLIYDNNICTVQGEKSAYMIDISLEKKELPIGSRI